jgi:nitroreductase
MDMKELVLKTRSYRRFYEDHDISLEVLRGLVELARLTASARNLQPLKFMVVNDRKVNAEVFPELGWAGYLKEWPGPIPGERPSAYIVTLGDTAITDEFGYDQGLATQSILLGATSLGLGGCIIGSAKKDRLRGKLAIPERYRILNVIALGKPKEIVKVEPLGPEGDVKYWRDAEGVHHVPKRALEDLIVSF